MNPFGIAPLLDRGFRLDPHERFLIAKIKTGQYCADLWDCNGLYVDYPERRGLPVYGTPLRYEITPERRAQAQADAAARHAAWLADAPQRARRAEKRAAEKARRDAEWARINREWEEKRAEKVRQKAERAAEWVREEAARKAEREAKLAAMRALPVPAEIVGFPLLDTVARRQAERAKIMAAPWQCRKCGKMADINPIFGRFRLSCGPCAESTFADHELLVRVVEAQAA